jgi:hypothetical protein
MGIYVCEEIIIIDIIKPIISSDPTGTVALCLLSVSAGALIYQNMKNIKFTVKKAKID